MEAPHPTTLNHELWPAIGFAADKRNLSGAWRLWELARHITKTGLILQADLKGAAILFGIRPSTYYNWREQALASGFLNEWGDNFQIPSSTIIVRILKPAGIEPRKVAVRIEDFFGRGWKAWLFDAHRAATSNPVSRRTTYKLTHKSPRSQRRYEKLVGIKARQNFHITDQEASRRDPAFREFARYQQLENGLHYTTVILNGKEYLARQLPNAYRPNKAASRKGGKTRRLEFAIANIRSEGDCTYLIGLDGKRQGGRLYGSRYRGVRQEKNGERYTPVVVRDDATLWVFPV